MKEEEEKKRERQHKIDMKMSKQLKMIIKMVRMKYMRVEIAPLSHSLSSICVWVCGDIVNSIEN